MYFLVCFQGIRIMVLFNQGLSLNSLTNDQYVASSRACYGITGLKFTFFFLL